MFMGNMFFNELLSSSSKDNFMSKDCRILSSDKQIVDGKSEGGEARFSFLLKERR